MHLYALNMSGTVIGWSLGLGDIKGGCLRCFTLTLTRCLQSGVLLEIASRCTVRVTRKPLSYVPQGGNRQFGNLRLPPKCTSFGHSTVSARPFIRCAFLRLTRAARHWRGSTRVDAAVAVPWTRHQRIYFQLHMGYHPGSLHHMVLRGAL
jgi:hypothetical protein